MNTCLGAANTAQVGADTYHEAQTGSTGPSFTEETTP